MVEVRAHLRARSLQCALRMPQATSHTGWTLMKANYNPYANSSPHIQMVLSNLEPFVKKNVNVLKSPWIYLSFQELCSPRYIRHCWSFFFPELVSLDENKLPNRNRLNSHNIFRTNSIRCYSLAFKSSWFCFVGSILGAVFLLAGLHVPCALVW